MWGLLRLVVFSLSILTALGKVSHVRNALCCCWLEFLFWLVSMLLLALGTRHASAVRVICFTSSSS